MPGPTPPKDAGYCARTSELLQATGTLGPDRGGLDRLLGGVLLDLDRIGHKSGPLVANSIEAAQATTAATGTVILRTCGSSNDSMATPADPRRKRGERAKKVNGASQSETRPYS